MLKLKYKNKKEKVQMRWFCFIVGSALLLITYLWPFYVYPVTSYNGSTMVIVEVDYSITFNFNGTYTTNFAGEEGSGYYKIQDKKIYVGTKSDFEITKNSVAFATIKNCYTIEINTLGVTLSNTAGLILTIIYGIMAGGGLLSIIIRASIKKE